LLHLISSPHLPFISPFTSFQYANTSKAGRRHLAFDPTALHTTAAAVRMGGNNGIFDDGDGDDVLTALGRHVTNAPLDDDDDDNAHTGAGSTTVGELSGVGGGGDDASHSKSMPVQKQSTAEAAALHDRNVEENLKALLLDTIERAAALTTQVGLLKRKGYDRLLKLSQTYR
jgi:hypothetical protein